MAGEKKNIAPKLSEKNFFARKKIASPPPRISNGPCLIMQKVISEVYNVVFGVRKQFTECEKQIEDCEKRFLESENSFRSAKVLPEAYREFCYAGPLGQNFFS